MWHHYTCLVTIRDVRMTLVHKELRDSFLVIKCCIALIPVFMMTELWNFITATVNRILLVISRLGWVYTFRHQMWLLLHLLSQCRLPNLLLRCLQFLSGHDHCRVLVGWCRHPEFLDCKRCPINLVLLQLDLMLHLLVNIRNGSIFCHDKVWSLAFWLRWYRTFLCSFFRLIYNMSAVLLCKCALYVLFHLELGCLMSCWLLLLYRVR